MKVLRGVPLQQAAFAPSMDDPFLAVLSEGMTHKHNSVPLRGWGWGAGVLFHDFPTRRGGGLRLPISSYLPDIMLTFMNK